jgi:hypothetical protein
MTCRRLQALLGDYYEAHNIVFVDVYDTHRNVMYSAEYVDRTLISLLDPGLIDKMYGHVCSPECVADGHNGIVAGLYLSDTDHDQREFHIAGQQVFELEHVSKRDAYSLSTLTEMRLLIGPVLYRVKLASPPHIATTLEDCLCLLHDYLPSVYSHVNVVRSAAPSELANSTVGRIAWRQ